MPDQASSYIPSIEGRGLPIGQNTLGFERGHKIAERFGFQKVGVRFEARFACNVSDDLDIGQGCPGIYRVACIGRLQPTGGQFENIFDSSFEIGLGHQLAYYNANVDAPKPPLIESSPELVGIAEAIAKTGVSVSDCVRIMQQVREDEKTQAPLLQLKTAVRENLLHHPEGEFERLMLRYAMDDSRNRVASLPVANSVKELFHKEFDYYRKPHIGKSQLEAGTYRFVTACKIVTLRRFPAGPLDWVVSGIPRMWFRHIPLRDLPRTLSFLIRRFKGIKPAFYTHTAPAPRSRSLLIEKEVRRCYYRMASSLVFQPEMKGILCGSWFHDPAIVAELPHLSALNEPYTRHGGFVTTVGPAPEDAGFLQNNPERRKQYEDGTFRPLLGLAMWPRKDAIEWAREHPELE
jgi:hypothetical protein